MKQSHFFICVVTLFQGVLQSANALDRPPVTDDRNWVCALNLTSGESQMLFSILHLRTVRWLAVSPDGKTFLYTGAMDGRKPDPDTHIWACDADGSNLRDLGRGTMPSWSPGGRRITFSRFPPERGVWIMRADGTNQQILDAHGWGARWSPDGRRIAWRRKIAGATDVAIYDIAEDDFTLLLNDGSNGYGKFLQKIAWSPDSQRLGVMAYPEEGIGSVSSFSATDDQSVRVHLLKKLPMLDETAWLDNKTMLITFRESTHPTTQMYAVAAQYEGENAGVTVEPQRIPGQFEDRWNGFADVSRDGRTLYYVSQQHRKAGLK